MRAWRRVPGTRVERSGTGVFGTGIAVVDAEETCASSGAVAMAAGAAVAGRVAAAAPAVAAVGPDAAGEGCTASGRGAVAGSAEPGSAAPGRAAGERSWVELKYQVIPKANRSSPETVATMPGGTWTHTMAPAPTAVRKAPQKTSSGLRADKEVPPAARRDVRRAVSGPDVLTFFPGGFEKGFPTGSARWRPTANTALPH